MNKSTLFISSHKITKSIMEKGDDYKITFGACLHFVLNKLNVETANATVELDIHTRNFLNRIEKTELSAMLNHFSITKSQFINLDDEIFNKVRKETTEVIYSDKKRQLLHDYRSMINAEIEAKKPKKASISKVRTAILKQKGKLTDYELGFIDELKGKRKLTCRQEKWLRDIAVRFEIEIVGIFENRLSQKEKMYTAAFNQCNCDMCEAERNGSESAGYFGSSCAKWNY